MKDSCSGPFVYPESFRFNPATFTRDYTSDKTQPQPDPLPVPRAEAYRLLGANPGRFSPVLPAHGRDLVPARHRQARPRRVLAHRAWGAHLAHRRPRGHRGVLHASELTPRRAPRAISAAGSILVVQRSRSRSCARCPNCRSWLALSAALPPNLSPIFVFLGITVILGLLDWPGRPRIAPCAREAPRLARGGFRQGGGADRRLAPAHHHAPSDTEFREPPDRFGHLVRSPP